MLIVVKYRFFSQHVYFWLLTLLSVSLPFSSLVTSVCTGLLLVNWLLEGNWRSRWQKVKNHKSLWFFLTIFLLYIVWLPANKNIASGIHDMIIKLPLLVLPIIMCCSEALEPRKIRLLLRFFIGSVVIATFIGVAVYYNFTPYKIKDVREISLFVPHIHLSILIVIAILTVLHWIKSEGRLIGKHHMLYILIIVWLVFFLFLLKSLSGVVILGITMFILILILLNTIENQFLKVWLIIIMYAIPFFSAVTFINAYNTFFEERDKMANLDSHTINGAPYMHDTLSRQIENGHRVWINVSEKELIKEWKRRSHRDFHGSDYKKQPLRHTLIRYMTSKGLKKDSVGIWQLTARDIANIENGMTNYIFQNNWSIYPRVYETIWEIHNYNISGTSSNKSITDRFKHMNAAFSMAKEKFWLGYGNTEINELLLNKYPSLEYSTDVIHNQFVRILLSFGLIGLFIFVAAFTIPPFFERKWPSYYFLMIFLILFLSFLNDDILEIAAGVNIMAFFYSLFLWGSQRRLL